MLIFICSSVSAVAQVPPAERQALIDLYNATDGDNWTNTVAGNQPWLINDPSSPVSDWFGVTVVDGKIVELTLQDNMLSGVIPASIGNLLNLETLWLHKNNLQGNIPSELGDLVSLKKLLLNQNGLTGELPVSLAQLSSLDTIWLTSNNLSGNIPDWLGNLISLKQLLLSNNQFDGTIPSSLGQLTLLETLWLSYNQLTGDIPLEIKQLANLTQFYLNNNQLSGTIPAEIAELQNLNFLRFQSNNFVFSDFELEHNTFLNNMTGFYEYSPQAKVDQTETRAVIEGFGITLTSTALTSPNNTYQWYKDGVAISGATSKEYIITNATNAVAGVYHFTATNSIVTDLAIERNPITITVVPDTCGVSDVQRDALLDLYNASNGDSWTNTLANNQPWDINIPVCDWYGVTVVDGRVTVLNLDNNALEGTLPDSMINLEYLTSLDLGNNSLSGVITPSIGALLELTSVSLDNNNFIGNIPPTLGSLSNLVTLELGNNNLIGSIPIAICNLRNLQVLDLSFNQLSEVLVSQLGLLTQLRRLDLSHNEFEGTVHSRIASLSNLEYLAINDNQLSGAIPITLFETSKLEEFYFQNNQFIFSNFESKHPDYVNYLNVGYTYLPQNKTDNVEIKNVSVGNSITLSTVMSSNSNNYQWFKNDQPITEATDREFVIEAASLNDAGTYYVSVTNTVVTGLTLERNPITVEVKTTCNVSDGERQALIDIYNATNGANWTNTSIGDQVWLINDPQSSICDWHGVIVENDTVVGLNLFNNNLMGTLPDVFANLPSLTTIQVNNNAIRGTLPSSITGLASLTTLNIDHNNYLFADLENDFNTYQTQLGVNFIYSPQAEVEAPDTKVIAVGSSVTLETNVFTSLNNTYQWFKDGVLINGATSLIYTIPTTTITDAGEYYLEASNTNVSGLTIKRNSIKVEITAVDDTCRVSEAEKQALIDLYNSTNGANWTNNANWLTDAPVCDWYGVTVDNGKVANLSFSRNNLSGVLPESIGDLKHLSLINFNSNAIEGTLPNRMSELKNLVVLHLGGNQLSGSFPEVVFNLNKLSDLRLNFNNFTGELPRNWEQLPNIRFLYLQYNNFTGNIPSELSELKRLGSMYLSDNQFTGSIPSELGLLNDLKVLTLNKNNLSGPIPVELGNLTGLIILRLSDNQLTGSIPDEFKKLTSLETLDIKANELSGTIPSEIASFNNFKYFFLERNNFIFSDFESMFYDLQAKLGTNFGYSPQAQIDQVENRDVVSGQSVTLTTSLISQNNKYQWYKDGNSIPGATNKEYIIDTASEADAGIYTVRVTNEIVTGLTLERNPITLSIINIANCEVSDEERLALIDFYLSTGGASWTNTVANNQAWTIDDPNSSVCNWYGVTVSEDAKVIGIQLPNNNIRGELPIALEKLKALKNLDLSKNSMVGAIPGWIGYLTNLEVVNLRENVLTGAIPSEIGDLSKLKILDLGINRLCCKIPESIGNLISMEYFDVSVNKLEGELPEGLWTISPLREVRLQDNTLRGRISEAISNLQNLQVLWLSENSFSGEFPQSIAEIFSLYSIRLNNNSFRGDLAKLIQNLNLPQTDIQIHNNAFVFSDFEPEHPLYRDNLTTYVYSPQARVDRTEYINVELGGTATLFTEALTSPNNTYRWYREDGTLVKETTLREITVNNITEADLGGYYFLATNSTIEELTLERNRIYLQLPDTNPDNPGTSTQSFCLSQGAPMVSDLISPIPGVTNVTWYTTETGGLPLLSSAFLIEESLTYWAESNVNEPRVPLRVNISPGAPGLPEEDYQQFTIVQSATVGDLQITGDTITWYNSPGGGVQYNLTDSLVDGGIYYAQQGNNACRFAVTVEIGVFDPSGDEWQSFCSSSYPKISDIEVEKTHIENTIIWYKNPTGTDQYTIEEPLEDNKTYYVAQRDNLGNESRRKAIKINIYNVPPPTVTELQQTFYSSDPVYISDLRAIGNNVQWFDDPYEGTAYGSNEVLVHGQTYYAAQSDTNCDAADNICCTSTDRIEVTVSILEEEPPSLVGCELFRPQPGARYVINGWVREDGVLAVNPVTQYFNNSEASSLFVELLNHLKDKLISDDPDERNLPMEYLPEAESRKYDVLVPFINKLSEGSKNFTVYDFKPVKERQYGQGPERTIGFSFRLDPSTNAPIFKYITPNVRYRTQRGRLISLSYHYPLLNQPSLELIFTDITINNSSFRLESSFSIEGGAYTYQPNGGIVDRPSSSILLPSYDKFDYIPDPDYEVMDYANSLLKLTYRNSEGNDIPMAVEDIEFRPMGAIIDGWQQVSVDFRIPFEAVNMVISLESRLTNGAASNLNVYFDDIRMHPFDGNMKTFVYDPVTQRLQAELDENNYATYYEYDQEGGLIRVKKETERGIYTIQETRSGNSKLNNSGR
ncbi:immunoglobulin domain-containing protein [Aquimarina sp. MMG016]|uniref:leucine-rich repeat domain-containing protein n=1 Tax=Aquimarina sp. MMG016 TaxID=2822690 RepID=UPI001B3A69E9|nr:immunoglobulin domain-containing protein [Aquimarina sp. MMG016]